MTGHQRPARHGRGFWSTTPEGVTMHVNGARDMPEEALRALGQLMDLAVKQHGGQREGQQPVPIDDADDGGGKSAD